LRKTKSGNAEEAIAAMSVIERVYQELVMIIVRSPLRITLGGGGTDLPSYYRDHGGSLIAAAIDKYVYITLHKSFLPGYILKYTELERVERACDIKHPIIRAAIELVGADDRIEIASLADIPSGTGLGSSGSFTTALLRALHTRKRNVISPHALADQACHIEIDLLREPVGKQDQFIAALGGVTAFENRCAHRAFPLSHSRIDGDRLVCGYHGCTYGNDQCDEELVAPAAWPADLRGRDGRDGVKRWTSPHHKTRIAILI